MRQEIDPLRRFSYLAVLLFAPLAIPVLQFIALMRRVPRPVAPTGP